MIKALPISTEAPYTSSMSLDLSNIYQPPPPQPWATMQDKPWLVVDPFSLPIGNPLLPILIESLTFNYTIVVTHLAGNGPVANLPMPPLDVVAHWEDFIGPFDGHLLIVGHTHMVSARFLAAYRSQPDWLDLIEPIQHSLERDFKD